MNAKTALKMKMCKNMERQLFNVFPCDASIKGSQKAKCKVN